MLYPLLLMLAVLTSAPLARLSAQELTPGTIVRIHQAGSSAMIGRIHRTSADSLWLQESLSERPHPLLRSTITRLEARQRVSRGDGAWAWAKRGFLLGIVAGAVICLADRENCVTETRSGNIGEGLLSSSLFFGGAGALYGAAGGALFPGYRWEPIIDRIDELVIPGAGTIPMAVRGLQQPAHRH